MSSQSMPSSGPISSSALFVPAKREEISDVVLLETISTLSSLLCIDSSKCFCQSREEGLTQEHKGACQ